MLVAPAYSAAANRNKKPILAVLGRVLPKHGLVLEIASGSGQHVLHFAAALPGLRWQPSDANPELLSLLMESVASAGLENVKRPLLLDVTQTTLPVRTVNAIVCINMIHVSPWNATLALFDGAERLLSSGDVLYLYGPFRRGYQHTAPSNKAFDASLQRRDPAWGIRDMEKVAIKAQAVGFALAEVVPMPANNFSLVFRKAK